MFLHENVLLNMSFAKPARERNTIANQSEDNSLLFNVLRFRDYRIGDRGTNLPPLRGGTP
jgi:hypothetical protein